VPLADVYDARSLIGPIAARIVAASRSRRSARGGLRGLIDEQERAIRTQEAFDRANARFHERLVARAGIKRSASSRRC
jgi:DNA-binding GntR family transcriptional regulator